MDRGERVAAMEPMLVSAGAPDRPPLNDRAIELAAASAGLRRSLPAAIRAPLADLVRAMNCYYSNLIEGHDTHPIDIERALRDDYSHDRHKRDLQLEARAHIEVQRWLDGGGLSGRAVTVEGLCEIHRRFGELLPGALAWVEDVETGKTVRVTPGGLRTRHVKVGLHVPVSPGAVPRFLRRYEEAYCSLGRSDAIVASAGAHHRLLWIHPFLDGNGRVARLMSHAVLLETLETGALWSIARGLARQVTRYKTHLAACDAPRQGDTEGRGTLSERALAEFTRFFLDLCLDQVRFMESLMQPDGLRARILVWTDEEVRLGRLPARAPRLMDALVNPGELARAQIAGVVGTGDRQARRIAGELMARGAVATDGPRAPVRLAFPAALAERWMPGLFPPARE